MEEKVMGTETVEETVEAGGPAAAKTAEEETLESAESEAADAGEASGEPEKRNVRERRTAQESRIRGLEDYIENVTNPDTRNYIKNRAVDQMNYYSRQSRVCKMQFQWLTGASIVLGALIPIASIFSTSSTASKVLIAFLGSAVTAINAFLAMFNSKDFWLSYRNMREKLLRTLYFYFNKTDVFRKVDDEENLSQREKEKLSRERDDLLIQLCEKALAGETTQWVHVAKRDDV